MASVDTQHVHERGENHPPHNHTPDEGGHHVDPLWLYLAIFGGLLVMTVITVGASYIDFGAANTAIAVFIATIKASLVAIFFMHLRHDKPFHSLVLVSALLFLSFLFLFTLSDSGTRNDVDDMHGKPIEAPAAATGSAAPAATAAPAGHLAPRGAEAASGGSAATGKRGPGTARTKGDSCAAEAGSCCLLRADEHTAAPLL